MSSDHAGASSGHLRRVLGLGFGLSVIVGGTIGTGILRTPGLVATQLPNATTILAAWIIGGLYTLLGSVCLTELGTSVPGTGGYYLYARRALGDWMGFAVGWTDWLTYCLVLGYVSIAIAEFIGVLVPSLAGLTTTVAVLALVLFMSLQFAGVRISGRFQEITTVLKFAAFVALIAACLLLPVQHGGGTIGTVVPGGMTLIGIIAALQAIIVTYGGWQAALYFTDEDRDPARNLPRSMIGGVLAVIAVYVLVNVALLAVLSIPELAASTLPASDAATRVLGDRGGRVITLLSILTLIPLLNAIVMIGTRIFFGMGQDGLLWRGAAALSARGTPSVATLVTTVVALALIASGTFKTLIAMTSFFLAFNYCVSCVALIVLRRREPNLARPFRAWGYPWSAWIVLVVAAVFVGTATIGDWSNSRNALGLLALGLAGRAIAKWR
ncbi:MAG: APC family permease [Vicinamibacterales bacterium]